MLAPANDFGYSPSSHHAGNGNGNGNSYDAIQHHHSGERPKIYGLDSHHPAMGMHGLVHHGMHDYQQQMHNSMTPQHNMTPQQQHHHHHHQQQQQHQGDFDHEPLMMNMHNAAAYHYPPMGGQLLHVSADYPAQPPSVSNSTPSSGSKRSREELNLKEKKRMFKLNDRINQLKDMLDEAGVQCKKNKQSILDNTSHYVSMLRSNLLIAQQKAERAEKQAEIFRSQAQQKNSNGGGVNMVFKRCFDQSSTPRLVMDLALQPVTYNHAFLNHTGLNEQSIKKKEQLRQFLCLDGNKLDRIVKNAVDNHKASSSIVQARTAHGESTLTLMVSVITDDFGKPVHLEFSLIVFEISSSNAHLAPPQSQSSYQGGMTKREILESSPSGVSDLSL
ncbi:DNA binding protein, partial [Globisporangium splendens]